MTTARASTGSLATTIADRIEDAIGTASAALHEPTFSGNEWAYVKECIDSTFVSSVGPFVARFESALAEFTGAARAVAVVNGTVALQIALQLAGVERGDEVLVPALSFVATTAAAVHAGAIPHFVDSDERTLGLDPLAVRDYLRSAAEVRNGVCRNRATGRIIRAVVPMHTFGHPVDMEGVLSVARDFHLVVVEDAAESLGSWIGARHTGTFGRVASLSFNGNKTVTTGGGGAILTNDPALGDRAKHLTTTARIQHRWSFIHDEVGYNFRMPNINAALGCAQLEQLPRLLEAKRGLFLRYRDALADVNGVRVMEEPTGTRVNYWLQALILDPALAGQRDEILAATNDRGLTTRPVWTLTHLLAPYRDAPRMPLDVAESLERRVINIPSSAHLGRIP